MMKKLTTLLFGLGAFISIGQIEKDAQLWSGIGISKDINKDFSLSYETQTRFSNNMTHLANYYNELSVKYDWMKGMDWSLTYRFARKNSGDYYRSENRFALDFGYGERFKDLGLKISARLRYQYAFDRLKPVGEYIPVDAQSTVRFRVKAEYKHPDFKRIQPFIKYELFHAINPQGNYGFIDANRYGIGVDMDLPKNFGGSVYMIIEDEFGSSIQRNFIYGFQLSYKLKGDIIPKKKSDGK